MKVIMNNIKAYNEKQEPIDKEICDFLEMHINDNLTKATSKICDGHPVWFIDENRIVGYSKQKKGLRLMFWSGFSFEE